MKDQTNYSLAYTSPIAVSDQPHRTLDTLDGWQGEMELPSESYGETSDFGQEIEIESLDLAVIEG